MYRRVYYIKYKIRFLGQECWSFSNHIMASHIKGIGFLLTILHFFLILSELEYFFAKSMQVWNIYILSVTYSLFL